MEWRKIELNRVRIAPEPKAEVKCPEPPEIGESPTPFRIPRDQSEIQPKIHQDDLHDSRCIHACMCDCDCVMFVCARAGEDISDSREMD